MNLSSEKKETSRGPFLRSMIFFCISVFFFVTWYERYLRWDFNELGRYYDSATETVYTESGFIWAIPAFLFLILSLSDLIRALRKRNTPPRFLWVAVSGAVLMGLFAFPIASHLLSPPTAEEVMENFHTASGRCEGMLMDPLILNADRVKARVIRDIADPAMDKRRYAIGFLGNCEIREALPALRTILNDVSEKDYFRGDALQSIFLIDEAEGLQRAGTFSDRDDFLGLIARDLLGGQSAIYRRTYADALSGRH